MKHFAVACGHEKTAVVAAEILRSGGNAVDAAIACFVASFISEPCMASAGGGAFAMIHTKEGQNILFDFFCETPKVKKDIALIDYRPITVDFGKTTEVFHIGRGSVAVPGAMAGVYALHKHFGTIPLSTLFEPAIKMAKEGVAIDRFQYYDFTLLQNILKDSERGRAVFFDKETGKLKLEGELIRFEYMADVLDHLSRDGERAFYHGEIAQKIVADQIQNGGFLTMDDFEQYSVKIRKPIQFNYRGKTVLTNPLPSKGGAFLKLFLADLESKEIDYKRYSTDHILHLIEAFKAVEPYRKNPDRLGKVFDYDPDSNKRGSTSHMSIVDNQGNAVSLTTTNGEGSSIFLDGTDIHLNNMLGEDALLPNGKHSWKPDVRLSSMMSPTMLLDKSGKANLVLGSGGAGRIPYMIAEVIHAYVDFGLSIEQAVNMSRLYMGSDRYYFEEGYELGSPLVENLKPRSVWDGHSLFFGGVHSIAIEGNKWMGIGDFRRNGFAISS